MPFLLFSIQVLSPTKQSKHINHIRCPLVCYLNVMSLTCTEITSFFTDFDPKCAKWAKLGYCYERGLNDQHIFMADSCKLSCGLCV